MACIDPRTDAVVIRIVYDGAPLAGKSSSVRSLGGRLGGQVITPAEVAGRTLYFDWLDYTGGLFEGRRIRCQIVSVPGQATLAPRRRSLLEKADAVVFVGDSSIEGLEADRRYLSGLLRVLADVTGPPIGVVYQANKRDHPDAVKTSAVQALLDEIGLRAAIVESVAPSGTGIREAFVFAVRLALDRVRELMRTRELQTERPSVDGADELLEQLRATEQGAMDLAASRLTHTPLASVRVETLAASALAEAVREESAAPASRAATQNAQDAAPAIPDDRVASGLIWPPIGGRTVLHQIGRMRIRLRRSDEGHWTGEGDGCWRLYSHASSVFREMEQGRSVLVQSARQYCARGQGTSLDQCLALAADGFGSFRLWHVSKASN